MSSSRGSGGGDSDQVKKREELEKKFEAAKAELVGFNTMFMTKYVDNPKPDISVDVADFILYSELQEKLINAYRDIQQFEKGLKEKPNFEGFDFRAPQDSTPSQREETKRIATELKENSQEQPNHGNNNKDDSPKPGR